MNHIYFIIYALSLLSGFIWLAYLIAKYEKSKNEIIKKYSLFFVSYTLLILSISIVVYMLVNIGWSEKLLKFLAVSVLSISSLMIYLQARFQFSVLKIEFKRKSKLFYLFPVMILPFTLITIIVSKSELITLLATGIQLLFFYILMISLQIKIIRDKNNLKSRKLKRLELAEILFSVLVLLVEVVFFFENFWNKGLIFSLPIIYLVLNITLLIRKEKILPFLATIDNKKVNFEESNLTKKEKQVAKLVKEGYSNKEIAYKLNISPSTVKNHIYNIFQKTNSVSRIDFLNKMGQFS